MQWILWLAQREVRIRTKSICKGLMAEVKDGFKMSAAANHASAVDSRNAGVLVA
jgi:hypothetical protein